MSFAGESVSKTMNIELSGPRVVDCHKGLITLSRNDSCGEGAWDANVTTASLPLHPDWSQQRERWIAFWWWEKILTRFNLETVLHRSPWAHRNLVRYRTAEVANGRHCLWIQSPLSPRQEPLPALTFDPISQRSVHRI